MARIVEGGSAFARNAAAAARTYAEMRTLRARRDGMLAEIESLQEETNERRAAAEATRNFYQAYSPPKELPAAARQILGRASRAASKMAPAAAQAFMRDAHGEVGLLMALEQRSKDANSIRQYAVGLSDGEMGDVEGEPNLDDPRSVADFAAMAEMVEAGEIDGAEALRHVREIVKIRAAEQSRQVLRAQTVESLRMRGEELRGTPSAAPYLHQARLLELAPDMDPEEAWAAAERESADMREMWLQATNPGKYWDNLSAEERARDAAMRSGNALRNISQAYGVFEGRPGMGGQRQQQGVAAAGGGNGPQGGRYQQLEATVLEAAPGGPDAVDKAVREKFGTGIDDLPPQVQQRLLKALEGARAGKAGGGG